MGLDIFAILLKRLLTYLIIKYLLKRLTFAHKTGPVFHIEKRSVFEKF